MDPLRHVLKRFAAWGTALRYKFAGDIFFRTTLYVIALQVGLVVIAIVAFTLVLRSSNQQIVNVIAEHLSALLSGTTTPTTLPLAIAQVQNTTTRYVFGGIIVVAACFGTLLAYLTLRPARTTLEYQKLFISNIAHELRTPLSIIKTSTEVALMDATLTSALRETLRDTVEELDRISGIINNLLSFSNFLRPEKMEFGNVDMAHVIDRAIERLGYLAKERAVRIRVHTSDKALAWGNETALEEVLLNLIKNAILYSPKDDGRTVSVSAEPDYNGHVECVIADEGIGIAKKDLAHVFEPFYRSDASRLRTHSGGSGLGLAIVYEIVRAHKGVIRVKSTLGKGTNVSVLLPVGHRGDVHAAHGEHDPDDTHEVSVDFRTDGGSS